MAFTVTGGAVTAIRALTDPARLAQVVPSWVTRRRPDADGGVAQPSPG